MTFERFSEIWEETIKNDHRSINQLREAPMNPRTREALIAYANGDKSLIDKIKKEFYDATKIQQLK